MENRILIIDDDNALCDLLRESLKKEKIASDIRHNGHMGLEALKKSEYQLVVLDIMMPGMSGFEVLEKIRLTSNIPVLMLTAKDDSASKVKGLRQGADDYLTKPFKMEEFLARVYSLIRRYTFFGNIGLQSKLKYEGMTIDISNRSVEIDGEKVDLCGKEFDILVYCAENQGRILTKKQIYEKVWGEEYVYDDNNIMAVISRIRKKVERNSSNPKYIQTVKGIGYRFNKEV